MLGESINRDKTKELEKIRDIRIQIPALLRPTLGELNKKFPDSRIKFIERDTSPTEAFTLQLVGLFRQRETVIDGLEYERRISVLQYQLPGYQHLNWLLDNQNQIPELALLRVGTRINFSGLIMISARGNKRVTLSAYNYGISGFGYPLSEDADDRDSWCLGSYEWYIGHGEFISSGYVAVSGD